MKRVLQITAVLMGLCILICGVILALLRGLSAPEPLVVVQNIDPNGGRSYLELTTLDYGFHRRLTFTFDALNFVGLDNEWVYFTAFDYYQASRTKHENGLYRVRLTGQDPVLLAPAGGVANGQMMTTMQAEGGRMYYVTYRPDGAIQLNRLDNKPPLFLPLGMNVDAILHTPPEDWMILSRRLDNTQNHLFRMRADGEDLSTLLQQATYTQFQAWLPEEEWLIVWADGQLWRMRLDGSDALPIGPKNVADMAAWIPQQQLVVADVAFYDAENRTYHNTLIGIRLSDGVVMWELPDRSWGAASPDGQWMLVYTNRIRVDGGVVHESSLERLQTDGTQRETLFETEGDSWLSRVFGWSPDGRSYLFAVNREDYLGDVWQGWLDGRSVNQPTFRDMDLDARVGWSPDGQLFAMGTKWTRLDGSAQGIFANGRQYVIFLSWLPPIDRAWSPIGLLILGGVLLLGGLYRKSRRATR